MNISCFK